ncbi:hypothetical protein ACQP0C_10920 [Nocardia sp. CA-129566]|uniref:hypothetical protein n=1 Tax=Nocardia sp. CA-129566 TaxID=3239976 RepID=UPI003D99EDAB
MELTVRRLVARSSVAAALALGPLVVLGPPQAAAEAPCPDGSARIFFHDETNTCQSGGTYSFDGTPALVKVCSVGKVEVTVDTTIQKSRTKTRTDHLDLSNGQCGRVTVGGQLDSTVTITPS